MEVAQHNQQSSSDKGSSVGFSRRLSQQSKDAIIGAIAEIFNDPIPVGLVDDATKFFLDLEKTMVGRIAGDIEDYIFNYIVNYCVSLEFRNKPELSHMEIGALFGGSLILSLSAIEKSAVDRSIITIDPLDGYYRQDEVLGSTVDIQTSLPINIETVQANVTAMGLAGQPYQVWQLYSTDSEAGEKAVGVDLSFLFIDGDHSYAGVKNDWHRFASRVVVGGYVLIDNYNDHAWPDVTRFVNKEVLGNDHAWEPLYCLNRSILFKRKSRAGSVFADSISNLTGRGVEVAAALRATTTEFRQKIMALGRVNQELKDKAESNQKEIADLKARLSTLESQDSSGNGDMK